MKKLSTKVDSIPSDGTKADSGTLPIAGSSSHNSSKPLVGCRYFFVTTSGKEPNSNFSINTFDVKTKTGKFPTIAECIEYSKKKYASQREIMLVAISEIKEADWEHFVSAQ